ncbi:hypothetical protein [Halomicronema sp. CCY15110]|uniref:hypothetical protein n=1 Tax=Halomicronema sp. CCY15110 TaxID=2767773 RepID=UPI00195044CD|nr:hypothetical protein [Halomicronema sp. CCY15110]
MPKSWFTLGGSVIFLIAVISLYLSTERQRTGESFQTSLQSVLPSVLASTSPNIDISANGDRWAMPSYQEQIADWQAQYTNITLDETDLTTPQTPTDADETASLTLSDAEVLVQNRPQFLNHLKQGLESLSDPSGLRALQPMLRSRLSEVSFQPSDQTSIERYANRQHLSGDAPELQYLDSGTIESLLSFRRILLEDVADAEASVICRTETAPDTGEELQTCIEVAPLGNRYSQYWIDDPNAAWW